jgi:hypothetical protein
MPPIADVQAEHDVEVRTGSSSAALASIHAPPRSGTLGTYSASSRSSNMNKDIDAPADECREGAERAKRAAALTADPEIKKQKNKIANDKRKEAIKIENDFA